MPYWVPSRMGPRRSRDPSPCPYASAIRQAAINLSALSMPSDRPNRCSASRSQRALGSYSRSSLPALLLPAPEQGRFSGQTDGCSVAHRQRMECGRRITAGLVSTQAPESGHGRSTEKGGPCHRERHGKSPRKPGPRSARHGSRHQPKARRPTSTPPRAAIAGRLTGAEDLRFSCRLFSTPRQGLHSGFCRSRFLGARPMPAASLPKGGGRAILRASRQNAAPCCCRPSTET